jgi:sugar phosphate isomerase/epimerase
LEILLENHSQPGAWKYPDFDFHMDRFLTLWDELKELPISVNFDTANAYALKDWKRLLNAVTGRIATIHLNDLASVEPLAFARVGEGIVPLEEMVRAVYATGYEGPICIEEAGFQGWEGTVKAVEYTCQLREAIQK